MIAINLGDPVDRGRQRMVEGGLTFPVALDEDPHATYYDGSGLTKQYAAWELPTLCLLDARGRIVWHAPDFRVAQLPEVRAALAGLGVR